MKFPKSVHAEGWADHLDTSVSDKSKAGPATGPLHAFKAGLIGLRAPSSPRVVSSALSAASPFGPAVAPRAADAARPQPRAAAALPPQRENRLSWMIGAGAGLAVLAAIAIWAMNKPVENTTVAPAIVTGSVQPQAEVIAAAPATPVAEAPAPVEPAPAPALAQVGLPVTTSKPAADARPLVQAPVPPPRPDMVVRAAPGSVTAPAPTTPYLQPRTTVAAAPATEPQALTVSPGTTPIFMPATSAGPVAVAPAQAAAPVPLVAAIPTPDLATPSTTPPQIQPAAEDSGITAQVRLALAADAMLSALPIAVSTDRGVVRLEGQAPDAPTRERATVVAASAAGVKAVDNRLSVQPATVVGKLQ